MTELTPRRIDPRRRESIEESGVAVVGSGAGMSSFDANRLRCEGWSAGGGQRSLSTVS